MKEIRITCDPEQRLRRIPLDELHPIQGELKEASVEDYEKFKQLVLAEGLDDAFDVWRELTPVEKKSGKKGEAVTGIRWHIIDGHLRKLMLTKMRDEEGYSIPDIPCKETEATSIKHAKRKVLSRSSVFHKMRRDGLYKFMYDAEVTMAQLKAYSLPHIELPKFEAEFFKDPLAVTNPIEGEDDVPEVPKVVHVKRGDLFTLGRHRLLCGDSTDRADVERLMNGEKADMVFTSPPYSDQRDYGGNTDLSPFHLAKSLLLPAKVYVVNLGYQRRNGEVFCYWNDWIHSAQTQGLKLLSWNIWDRQYPASIGQQTAMFPIEHEWVFVFGREIIELNRTIENKYGGQEIAGSSNREKDGSMTKSRVRVAHSHRPLGTILRCDIHRGESPHPAMFPVSFPEAYINAIPSHIVADPFSGSGSTLIACEKANRRCFGMEIDPLYCSVILDRWAKFTGEEPKREDGTPWSYIKDGGD